MRYQIDQVEILVSASARTVVITNGIHLGDPTNITCRPGTTTESPITSVRLPELFQPDQSSMPTRTVSILQDVPMGADRYTVPHSDILSLNAFYASAWKNGYYPAITYDQAWVMARPHPASATASSDPYGQPTGSYNVRRPVLNLRSHKH